MSSGSGNWIPRRDTDFDRWFDNLVTKVVKYAMGQNRIWDHIPIAEIDKLLDTQTAWINAWKKLEGPHTHPDVIVKNTARADSETVLRSFRGRFLDHWATVTDAHRAELGIPIRDREPTPIDRPLGMPHGEISYEGPGLLCLHMGHLVGTPLDEKADYGYRIYWGILPPGGATVEQAVGKERQLMRPPETGDELPHSVFDRKKKRHFDFTGHSASTAFFSIRYENDKGEYGPFCPVFSAIIP